MDCSCKGWKYITFRLNSQRLGADTSVSGAETWSPNPTCAKILRWSNRDLLFHSLEVVVPSASSKMCRINPRRASLPVPQTYPLKNSLRVLQFLIQPLPDSIKSYSMQCLKVCTESANHICPLLLVKTLMLGGIGGRRRRGWQRMRWLDCRSPAPAARDSTWRDEWCRQWDSLSVFFWTAYLFQV